MSEVLNETDGMRGLLATSDFYDFICRPDQWAPVFGIGTTRRSLSRVVMEHAQDELAETCDPHVASIIAAEMRGQVETGLSEQDAALHLANVLNYTAFQFVGRIANQGGTVKDLPFEVADIH